MSDEWNKYVKDPRTICKYGTNCYQKSPQHHSKFKHPPQNIKRKNTDKNVNKKRIKTEIDNQKQNNCDVNTETDNKNITKVGTETSTNSKEDKTNNPGTVSNTSKEGEKVCEYFPPNDLSLPNDLTYYDTNVNIESTIKELFLVDMPSDFLTFYECLKEESNFEKILSGVNLQLIGPYDLLMGKLPILDNKELYLIHWRFFYDPPEFQSVLKTRGKSEYHIGYFRDSPDEMPVFLASNDSAKDCHITPIATNIFATVYSYLQNEKRRSPFTAMASQKFMDKVKVWAEKHKFSLEPYDMKTRLQHSVTKSFHGAGIVVPYDKKTKMGYRKLVENDATIKKIIAKIEKAESTALKEQALSELQPVITYASIAVDESDFGTGLELGINLFASGLKQLHQYAKSVLCSTYPLLKRDSFCEIIQAHLKYRRKGPKMSLINEERNN